MLSLKILSELENTSVTVYDQIEISDEDVIEIEEEKSIIYFEEAKKWKEFFNRRESGNITQHWEIPTFKDLPKSIQLNSVTYIEDVAAFVRSHSDTVKANNGNKTFIGYLDRLNELKHLCENQNYRAGS